MSGPTDLSRLVDTLRDRGAAFGLVFGSRARGDQRPDSDVDVGAWFPRRSTAGVGGRGSRRGRPGRPQPAGTELAGRIALEGTVLFDDDPPARVRWVADTRKIWLDEKPRFQRAHREFLEVAARGR